MQKSKSKYLLFNYFSENSDQLLSNIENAKIKPGVNNIHAIRVCIKRIRAIYKVFERLSKGKFIEKNHSGIFKKIFKETGKLRDMQIKMQLLNKFESTEPVNSFRSYLTNNKNEIHANIDKSLKDFESSKFNLSIVQLKVLISSVKNSEVEIECIRFILLTSKTIKKLIESEKSTEQIHTIRKLLKELHSATEILLLVNPVKHLKGFLRLVKKIEVELGKWHDNIILLISLCEYTDILIKNNKIPDAILSDIETEVKAQNKNMLNNLIPEINLLIKSIK